MVVPWSHEHASGAVEVVRQVFDEYRFTWDSEGYHADLYDVPGHYLHPGNMFWIALHDDIVVGTCALELFPALPAHNSGLVELAGKTRIAGADCSLNRLYVRPDSRRLGNGRRLMETALEAAKAHGRRVMEIWSDKRFEGAHNLYAVFGAETVGDRICDDPDVSPEWGLRLRL